MFLKVDNELTLIYEYIYLYWLTIQQSIGWGEKNETAVGPIRICIPFDSMKIFIKDCLFNRSNHCTLNIT